MIENKVFGGILNYDDDNSIIPSNHHKDALNIVFRGNTGNMKGENLPGNSLLPNSMLPSGTNRTIGYHVDEINKRIFFFNYNSAGNHGIYIYNTASSTFQTLLQNYSYKINPSDTITRYTNGYILNFTDGTNPQPITSIGIIYGDAYNSSTDTGGDILIFVDCLGIPNKININRYLNGYYSTVDRTYIDLAKAPPRMPVKAVYENSKFSVSSDFNISSQLVIATPRYFNIVITGTIVQGISINISFETNANFNDGPGNSYNLYSYTTSSSDTITTLANSIVSYLNAVLGQNFTHTPVLLYSASVVSPGVVRVFVNSAASNNTLSATTSNFTFANVQVYVNNLRNKLFKFRYRYVYDDYEKSVWSSVGEMPLPNQDSSLNTSPDSSKNSKLALYFSTGGLDVKKIELAVQITEDGVTRDWQLFDTIDKSIDTKASSNSIYERYLFYNNSTLLPIPQDDINQLFDFVPQSTNSMALLNGNVPAFGGITEGYDLVSSNQSIANTLGSSSASFIYTAINGCLFFAQTNGLDSGSSGTTINFYLTGTGTNNTLDQPTDLSDVSYIGITNNVYLTVKMADGSLVDKSVSVPVSTSIATTFTALSTALVSNGFTVVSTSVNKLTVSYPSAINLFSSGLSMTYSGIDGNSSMFSYLGNSSEYFGIQYFDSKGRTNGVITNSSLKATFQLSPILNSVPSLGVNFPSFQVAKLSINHTPPSWATYYQIVRSQNLSYNKILHWVTCGAGADSVLLSNDNRFVYFNISNIADYNDMINSTSGVVSYDFSPGDRISICGRFTATGTYIDFTNPQTGGTPKRFYDYEILGMETNPIFNGVMQSGTFIKIAYPPASDLADSTSNLNFDNGSVGIDYQNYRVVIYNLREASKSTESLFFEFGKCFGIGNAGTNSAYHIGLEQNQTASQPAIISINNGDFFYRKRNVLISGPVEMAHTISDGFGYAYNSPALSINFPPGISSIVGANYVIQNSNLVQSATVPNGDYSTDANFFFRNTSSTGGIKVRVRCTLPIRSQVYNNFAIYLQALKSDGTYVYQNILKSTSVSPNVSYQYEIDSTIIVPPGAKLRMLFINYGPSLTTNIYVDAFTMRVDAMVTYRINILDSSFSDYFKLENNSNGRATAIDVNAKRSFNGALIRWGRPKQTGTNINETNRFFDLNYDEVDRQYGPIMRMDVNGQRLHIFQYRKTGAKGIYNKYIKNSEGEQTLTVTDAILTPNNIDYYIADFGIGNQPSSLIKNGYQYYFVDPIKGYILRLSQNGIEPISDNFKMQTFSGNNLPAYSSNQPYASGGFAKVVSCYNFTKDRHGEVIFCLQAYTGNNGYTLAFDEVRNCFTSFYSFNADMIVCSENQLFSFKNGNLYIHNSSVRNNFYGTQYGSSIKLVFNKDGVLKKTFDYITIDASAYWTAPNIGDINTGLGQVSNLVQSDFEVDEGLYSAAFWMDNSSLGGVINGDYLKGDWIEIKLTNNLTNLVYLSSCYLSYILSNRNT